MASLAPYSPPLGDAMPNSPHAVTCSLPTWQSVIDWTKREPSIFAAMKTGYPRFYIPKHIRDLSSAVLGRLNLSGNGDINLPDEGDVCGMIFVDGKSAARCVAILDSKNTDSLDIDVVHFHLPSESSFPALDARWLSFHIVLYPDVLGQGPKEYWRDCGDGISTRHAQYCLEHIEYLESTSAKQAFCTEAPRSPKEISAKLLSSDGSEARKSLKMRIAQYTTSDDGSERVVKPEDIILYPRGMRGIYAVLRSLASMKDSSTVVAYGWLYTESLKIIEREYPGNHIFYGFGNTEELDELEAKLQAGTRVQAVYCEFPGNPLLMAPNLERVGKLAREYDFIVACDESVATFVNVDLLPVVDILISSLTKMFGGYSDVMGGSVVINPKSRHYDLIRSHIMAEYEEALFPQDLEALSKYSGNFVERVKTTNSHGKMVAEYIAKHSSVAQVLYPSMGPKAPLYERYMRRDGGYGHLMSIVFHEEQSAIVFYESLDVCKGTSFGTNFSLAIPFVQLAYQFEQEFVESYGICKHLVRLSVGLEDLDEILKTVARALQKVEEKNFV